MEPHCLVHHCHWRHHDPSGSWRIHHLCTPIVINCCGSSYHVYRIYWICQIYWGLCALSEALDNRWRSTGDGEGAACIQPARNPGGPLLPLSRQQCQQPSAQRFLDRKAATHAAPAGARRWRRKLSRLAHLGQPPLQLATAGDGHELTHDSAGGDPSAPTPSASVLNAALTPGVRASSHLASTPARNVGGGGGLTTPRRRQTPGHATGKKPPSRPCGTMRNKSHVQKQSLHWLRHACPQRDKTNSDYVRKEANDLKGIDMMQAYLKNVEVLLIQANNLKEPFRPYDKVIVCFESLLNLLSTFVKLLLRASMMTYILRKITSISLIMVPSQPFDLMTSCLESNKHPAVPCSGHAGDGGTLCGDYCYDQ